jgi:hypothetical protein
MLAVVDWLGGMRLRGVEKQSSERRLWRASFDV